jgi:hypothetical protein
MYRMTAIIATTHVDLHGERLAISALEDMVRQVDEAYIPVMWNHDIRFPPLGRSVSAKIIELPDDEHALETESEIWEPSDRLADLAGDGRSVVTQHLDEPGFEVRVDRGLSSARDREAAEELAALAGPGRKPVELGKKALEPDAVLVVAVGTIAGSIALGFFQHLGEDLYDHLKSKLSRLVAERERSLLIDFDITFERNGRKSLHVLLDGPNAAQIEDLFDRRFEGLDVMIETCLEHAAETDHVVATWLEGQMVLNYVVRRDGVPIMMGRAIPEMTSVAHEPVNSR